jgi:hypothetical protein
MFIVHRVGHPGSPKGVDRSVLRRRSGERLLRAGLTTPLPGDLRVPGPDGHYDPLTAPCVDKNMAAVERREASALRYWARTPR